MIRHIYFAEVGIDIDIAKDLFMLAHEYLLDDLKNDCQRVLIQELKVDNVLTNIQFAEKYDAQKLRKACLHFIVNNLHEVFITQDIKILDKRTLLEIYELKC